MAPRDEELIRRCLRGDQDAWAEIVARYGGYVAAVGRRAGLSSEEADDIVQETFLALLRHLDALDDPSRLAAWLGTTARRAATKAAMRRPDVVEVGGAHPAPEPPPDDDDLLLRALVWDAVARLPARCRELLTLLYGSRAATYEDVSRKLGMPIGSIGPTRARCLDRLRRIVDQLRGLQ